jgi:hypothetical protein
MDSANSCIGNQIDYISTTNDNSIGETTKRAKVRGTIHYISIGDSLLKLGLNESVEIRVLKFSHSSTIVTCIVAIVPTLNSQIKASSFFQMQVQGCCFQLLFIYLLT